VSSNRNQLERLQQLAALGELGAGVSHEVRNILTGIVGFAQIARQRKDVDGSRRHVELIEREALRCVEILERFLTFARIGDAEPELVDVGPLLQQVVDATGHQLAMHRLGATVHTDEDLPPVYCDRGALTQAVLNLVINAMHASPEGATIAVTAERAGAGVEIAIADHGHGIAPELHEKIFEPFFTTKPAGKGTGLGLAMCRRIASEAGGSISVESAPGHGARFALQLPSAEDRRGRVA
jgi:two-component system sensor histidine kinase HydH